MTNVLLPNHIVQEVRSYLGNSCGNNEHGGLLLGFRKPSAIQIHSVTFPDQWDRSTPTRFHRSQRGHKDRAIKEWLSSGKTVDWVGEWHSHPFGTSLPSSIDRDSWKRIVSRTARPMVFIIFGRLDMYVGLQTALAGSPLRLVVEEKSDSAALYG